MFGGGGLSNSASSTGAFDGAGSDPTAGFATDAGSGADPFAAGGAEKSFDDGASNPTSYDQGGDAFGGGGGDFDSGGFDDNA